MTATRFHVSNLVFLQAVLAAAFTAPEFPKIHKGMCDIKDFSSHEQIHNGKCPIRKKTLELYDSQGKGDINDMNKNELNTNADLQHRNMQGEYFVEDESAAGKIVRCAARSFDKESSQPSSRQYTTRKKDFPLIHITPAGVTGDYNHYRSTALNSTPDRAVSIVTTDVMEKIRENKEYAEIESGDLGENILVEGLPFTFFKIGERYKFGDKLLVEITERIEPCANLCKLRFINKDSLAPRDRMKKCIDFLGSLDDVDGKRGWYAKVLSDGGVVKIGDEVTPV